MSFMAEHFLQSQHVNAVLTCDIIRLEILGEAPQAKKLAGLCHAMGRGVHMQKSCQYCGRLHPVGYECPKRPKRKKLGRRQAERFRNTYAWRKTRERVKDRDGHLCRYCLAHGVITSEGLEVHHIEPLEERPDLGLVDEYLVTLCGGDHERAERGQIGKEELLALASTPPVLGVRRG